MTKLDIKLQNCYGIRELEKDFAFSEEHSTFSIYASNGSMKTSFAKTFEDISNGENPKDLIFPERITVCEVKFDDEVIQSFQIFVIQSYNEKYKSEKISTLLANKELRMKYEQIYETINRQKDIFLKGVKRVCKISKVDEIEELISKVFHHNEANKFFESLERIKTEINSDEIDSYKDIKYKDVFTDKLKEFLNDGAIQANIKEYIKKYDELLDNSTYFKKGIFNHSQAEDTAKKLKNNGFFKAKHAVLFGGKKLSTELELTKVINQEKENILTDETLKSVFDKLDDKITKNEGLKNLREFLSKNSFIIAELRNLESFEAKLWKYYIKENQSNFNDLLEVYSKGKEGISKISKQAKQEETKWLNAIKIFNERFVVPFEVTISNKTEVILKEDTPSIAFQFVEKEEKKNIKRDKLLDILSQGEKRALYILDIIFEIEARKTEYGKHLFIIDDIADSFDYKNKYAIIEYLRDISKTDNFYQIVLSHNFDFHRTISSRLSMERKNKLVVKKQGNKITLEEEKYQNNPFLYWKNNLGDKYKIIACIPFVRNLAEYSGKDGNYQNLTSFLHIKENENRLTLENLKIEFNEILSINLDGFDQTGDFLDFLNDAANVVDINTIELEHKITLAISIRLKAEKFIIDKIDSPDFINSIDKNHTAILINKYKEQYAHEIDIIKILDKVQLMTPESIHLNSFMYEPLLDMSGEYLVNLYKDISNISRSHAVRGNAY